MMIYHCFRWLQIMLLWYRLDKYLIGILYASCNFILNHAMNLIRNKKPWVYEKCKFTLFGVKSGFVFAILVLLTFVAFQLFGERPALYFSRRLRSGKDYKKIWNLITSLWNPRNQPFGIWVWLGHSVPVSANNACVRTFSMKPK